MTNAKWTARELEADAGWIYEFGPAQCKALRDTIKDVPGREHMLDYEMPDFDLGPATVDLDGCTSGFNGARSYAVTTHPSLVAAEAGIAGRRAPSSVEKIDELNSTAELDAPSSRLGARRSGEAFSERG